MYGVINQYTVRPSHPTRGEWIEIANMDGTALYAEGLTPHGVSGLKYAQANKAFQKIARSHPTRGEWIEIPPTCKGGILSIVSPHTG